MSQGARALVAWIAIALASLSAIASEGTDPGKRIPRYIVPMTRPGEQPEQVLTTGHLEYFGGPVIGSVKVYQVLWGSGTYGPGVASGGLHHTTRLGDFYSDVTDSVHMDWLSEYDNCTQRIGRGSFASTITITPSPANNGPTITDAQIQSELASQISGGTLPAPDPDTVFMINFPQDKTILDSTGHASCADFCGYHFTFTNNGAYVYYAVLPELVGTACATGCGSDPDLFNDLTSVASHELIEVVTDPAIGIWVTNNPSGGSFEWPVAWDDPVNQEIGDICHGFTGTIVGPSGATFTVQLEWSNRAGACVVTTTPTSPDGCQVADHSVTIGPPSGQTLQGYTIKEKWRDKAKAISRTCKKTDKTHQLTWLPTPGNGPVDHVAHAAAPGSDAAAHSGVNVPFDLPTLVIAESCIGAMSLAPTTSGCQNSPAKRRKHRAKVVAVQKGKVKVESDGPDGFNMSKGTWRGFWGNCRSLANRNRDRLLGDPLVAEFSDRNTGQLLSREVIVDIQSHVWNGATYWTQVLVPDCEICFLDSVPVYRRIIKNTATRMTLSVAVQGTYLPTSQKGTLDIATDCDSSSCATGHVTSVSRTGRFTNTAQYPDIPVVGQSAQFTFTLPDISFDLQLPANVVVTTIEGGGDAGADQLPDTAIEVGCNMATSLGDGLSDVDTSTPIGADSTLGFPATTSTNKIAQEFIVPGLLPLAVSFAVVYYQQGLPVYDQNGDEIDPTVQSADVQIYNVPPPFNAPPLYSCTTPAAEMAVDVLDIDRRPKATADDGSKPLVELALLGSDTCPEAVLSPGPKWVVVSISGDANFGAAFMPQCPFPSSPAADDHSWGFNAGTGQWGPLIDAGSGRRVKFPIDVFAADLRCDASDSSCFSPGRGRVLDNGQLFPRLTWDPGIGPASPFTGPVSAGDDSSVASASGPTTDDDRVEPKRSGSALARALHAAESKGTPVFARKKPVRDVPEAVEVWVEHDGAVVVLDVDADSGAIASSRTLVDTRTRALADIRAKALLGGSKPLYRAVEQFSREHPALELVRATPVVRSGRPSAEVVAVDPSGQQSTAVLSLD